MSFDVQFPGLGLEFTINRVALSIGGFNIYWYGVIIAAGMVLAMLPMFLLAMYEKNGQPLEVIIRQFVEVKFLRPKERPYQTNNFYTALARQERLDKEVRAIVKGKEKHPKRKA